MGTIQLQSAVVGKLNQSSQSDEDTSTGTVTPESSSKTSLSSHPTDDGAAKFANTTLVDEKIMSTTENKLFRVAFLTEQVSHHPPVSAFYAECRDRGVSMYGHDHAVASFTGTCGTPCRIGLTLSHQNSPRRDV